MNFLFLIPLMGQAFLFKGRMIEGLVWRDQIVLKIVGPIQVTGGRSW